MTKPVDYPVAFARIQAHLRTREATRAAAPVPDTEPRTPAQAVPGSVLGGRYRLESRIGGGSFGIVFRSHHQELDRPVAVKVLSTSADTDPEALARFRREGASACPAPSSRETRPAAFSPFGPRTSRASTTSTGIS